MSGYRAINLVAWLGGLSLSWGGLCCLAIFCLVHVLRRKGYAVRLGLGCLVFRARPGSRRFPQGVEVRVCTRLVGFFFTGGRGPWLDIYSDHFTMRLRAEARPRRWTGGYSLLTRYLAVDRRYWHNLIRHIVQRLALLFIRGLRFRASKVRIWKEASEWEFSADTFLFGGNASGVFGSKYTLSVNELSVRACVPHSNVLVRVMCTRGIELAVYLSPRIASLVFSKRRSVVDDLQFTLDGHDLNINVADGIIQSAIKSVNIRMSPEQSQSRRVRLSTAPVRRNNTNSQPLISAWEAEVSVCDATLRLNPIPHSSSSEKSNIGQCDLSKLYSQSSLDRAAKSCRNDRDEFNTWLLSLVKNRTSSSGSFMSINYFHAEAYGVSKNRSVSPAVCVSFAVRGFCVGTETAYQFYRRFFGSGHHYDKGHKRKNYRFSKECRDSLTRKSSDTSEYEVPWNHDTDEFVESILTTSPELLFMIEDLTGVVDYSMTEDNRTQVELGSRGVLGAIEPLGFTAVVSESISCLRSLGLPSRFVRSDSSNVRHESDDRNSAHPDSGTRVHVRNSVVQEHAVVVVNLRHCLMLQLNREPVGDSDTLALVFSTNILALPKLEFKSKECTQLEVEVCSTKLMHWSKWSRSENFFSDSCTILFNRASSDSSWDRTVALDGLDLRWDLDLHSAFLSASKLMFILNNCVEPCLAKLLSSSRRQSKSDVTVNVPKRLNSSSKLKGWSISGSGLKLSSEFPDGPSLSFSIDKLPKSYLSADSFTVQGCDVDLSGYTVLSVDDLTITSPLNSLGPDVLRPKIEFKTSRCRSVLKHDVQLGSLIQDWLIRIKAVIQVLRAKRFEDHSPKAKGSRRRQTPDIVIRVSDLDLEFEDHPLASFFTAMIPLFQDECRDRIVRYSAMQSSMEALESNARSEIAGSAIRCWRRLNELDSQTWIRRVKELKKQCNFEEKPVSIPLASVRAQNLNIAILMDEETRHSGTSESLRKLRFLDEYQLGPRKRNLVRQYDLDVWNMIGFRVVRFETESLLLSLRDYPESFLTLNRISLDRSIIGQAQQATVSPHYASTQVALGRRRVGLIGRGLANTKIFADVHLVVDEIVCNFNPAQLGAIVDFGRACARFSPNGKNPSPRLPWFDNLRVNCHGRFRITAKILKGTMASSNSPYSKTRHYTNIFARNVLMVASRMKPTRTEKFPISWELQNLHFRPNGTGYSDVEFEHICVGLTPVPECNSGDAQDHYFIPFPTKEEVRRGGPGIGRGTLEMSNVSEPVAVKLSPLGCYTVWSTGHDNNPKFDSYFDFKTRRLTLGVDVTVRHSAGNSNHQERFANSKRFSWVPQAASVLDSDGLSTLVKVIRNLVSRPIFCRLAPRMIDRARKPPSITGLSSSLVALDLSVNFSDLNVMLQNNVHPGHGLHVTTPSLYGELTKQTRITWTTGNEYIRDSRIAHRKVEVKNLTTRIRTPDIDLAGNDHGIGPLLTISRIFLSDDANDEPEYAASPRLQAHSRVLSTVFGSADHDRSPFYTFSASHAFQRKKKLDRVKFDLRLAVDDVCLLWSPARRISLWTWPDAFKEKRFCMKSPQYSQFDFNWDVSERNDSIEDANESYLDHWTKSGRPKSRDQDTTGNDRSNPSAIRRPEGSMMDILKSEVSANDDSEAADSLFSAQTTTLETMPTLEFLINRAQVCIGSPETAGLVFLTSEAARIGIVEKTLQRVLQVGVGKDRWTDKEYRVHLKDSNVHCQTEDLKMFDLHSWLPLDQYLKKVQGLGLVTRVTTNPMCMDLVYIRSFSIAKDDDDSRPSLIFINVRDITMASTSVEFRAVTDVVRKVLMQRDASSVMVKDELAKLRYNLQLRNRQPSSGELGDKMRRLNSITKQFLYAADTSQEHLVDRLLPCGLSFEDSLKRYKSQAKAVATFERTDQRASQAEYQYPTMYVSYSFDNCGWELREIQEHSEVPTPIVEISLSDLVCRHIFYVGRGSSTEITFRSIGAVNRMAKSYFEDLLKPAKLKAGKSDSKGRSIKASDGASVAFRWYSTQTDKVGGIPVYDLLTIQVAPLNAAVSRRLYHAVSKFIFPPRNDVSRTSDSSSTSSARSSLDDRTQSPSRNGETPNPTKDPAESSSRISDYELMAQRSQSTILFKYVFVDTFELTASFKNKERDRSILDFSNLFVSTPSFSYSSEVWTWKDFANRIKRDLVYTFARRGVSNLAKIKFLPGYSRAKMKLVNGAENMQKSFTKRINWAEDGQDSDCSNDSESNSSETYEEPLPTRMRPNEEHKKYLVRVLYGNRAAMFASELERLDNF